MSNTKNWRDKAIPIYIPATFFLLTGLLLFRWVYLQEQLLARSASWHTTQGFISVSRRLKTKTGTLSDISYSYWVNDKEYVNDRIYFGHNNTRVKLYPLGKEVVVFYNPQDPQQASLNRKISPDTYGWIPLATLFSIGGLLYFSVFLAELAFRQGEKSYRKALRK